MKDVDTHKALMALIDSPRSEWYKHIPVGGANIQQVELAAAGLAQGAAEISEYLTYRGGAGFGDHGHEAALKAAGKRLKKVRKALGYNIP